MKEVLEIDLLCFDWSGTISDDRKPVYHANSALYKRFGLEIEKFEVWMRDIPMTIDDALIDRGVKLERAEIRRLYREYLNTFINLGILPVVYPDAFEVLSHLKARGKKLAVLSSHPEENLRKECKVYGLSNLFSFLQGDSTDKAQGLKAILTRLQTNPERTLYIGDTIHDIIAAKLAGVHSVAVSTGYHTIEKLRNASPDILIENLSALRNGKIR